MSNLGYSYHLNEKNMESLYSLNESIKALMDLEEVLIEFKEIEFELNGVYLENNLKLMVNYETKKGKKGSVEFSSYVDESAIEAYKEWVIAYYGEDKYEDVEEILDSMGGSLSSEYLKENELELFNQLCEEYLLQCSPDVNNGSEFTSGDRDFFKDLLENK